VNPLVSVIIPTYNYGRFVAEAVESALAQTYRTIEVIVVDDGSTDGTQAVLSRFAGRIRYLFQENRGLSAARNRGIGAARGEFLGFLDADDLWDPTKIAKQVTLIERSPQVGAVYCEHIQLHVPSGETKLRRCLPELRGDIHRALLELKGIGTPSCVLIRRACFDKVGLFDEELRSVEDWEMWVRVSRHFEFDYVPEPLVTYRVHGQNLCSKIGTMQRYRVQAIQRAFRPDRVNSPSGLLHRRALGRSHWITGKQYHRAGEHAFALRHLLQSIALWPFDSRSYRSLASVLRESARCATRRAAVGKS
jgi:glycosyltransferase involved in cell wall biosynthesis